MAKIIKCTCEECRYNEDQMCNAGAIEVRSNGDNNVEPSAEPAAALLNQRVIIEDAVTTNYVKIKSKFIKVEPNDMLYLFYRKSFGHMKHPYLIYIL